VKLRDDSGTKSKELQITCLRKEIKELEQDLLLTKLDLVQVKIELDVMPSNSYDDRSTNFSEPLTKKKRKLRRRRR